VRRFIWNDRIPSDFFRLTGGKAYRCQQCKLTMALDENDWDNELLALFDIAKLVAASVVDCAGDLGETSASLLVALFHLALLRSTSRYHRTILPEGQTSDLGTGAFILTNSGEVPPKSEPAAIHGAIKLTGNGFMPEARYLPYSLQWLRDDIGSLKYAGESEELARSVDDNGGVYYNVSTGLAPALAR
jgi:glycerol kinase